MSSTRKKYALPVFQKGDKLIVIRKRKSENYNLWCNHGTWWISYTILKKDQRVSRIRHSLGVKDEDKARELRDKIFERLASTLGTHNKGSKDYLRRIERDKLKGI